MRFIEIEAAQEIFDSLIDEVEQGTAVMLTRDCVVVAKLIPFEGEMTEAEALPQTI